MEKNRQKKWVPQRGVQWIGYTGVLESPGNSSGWKRVCVCVCVHVCRRVCPCMYDTYVIYVMHAVHVCMQIRM